MKLKKIASLALAGIMAVSMLAGCGEAASSSEPTQPENPTVGGYTDAVYELTGSDTQSVLQMKSNVTLNTAFQNAMDLFQDNYFGTLTNTATLTQFSGTGTGISGTVNNAMDAELGSNYVVDKNSPVTDLASQTDDKVYVHLFYVTSNLTDAVLNQMVADEVDTMMDNVDSNTNGSDTINYYLTVDKITKGSTNNGVNIVMVAVERATTKA